MFIIHFVNVKKENKIKYEYSGFLNIMSFNIYLIGISLAISSGVSNNLGIVFQKKALNELPKGEKVGKHLLKNPLWLLGFILNMVITSVLSMIAQLFIGPALIPGLMASGLIVLALGSLKILHEKLSSSEIIGIILIIIAISSLGFSELSVDVGNYDLGAADFLIRVMIFTIILFIGSIFCISLQNVKEEDKGILLALDSGFMFGIINFWMGPLMGLFARFFSGSLVNGEFILFISACVILPVTNYLGILRLQQAFEHGQASNMRVTQQVPVQILPMFYYFVIFLLPPPTEYSLCLGLIGVCLTLIGGYLLAKRQARLEEIK